MTGEHFANALVIIPMMTISGILAYVIGWHANQVWNKYKGDGGSSF